MCNRVLLLFGKMPLWNLYVNCHVSGTTFQSGLRFQTGLSSLRVSCKRAHKCSTKSVFTSYHILLWNRMKSYTMWCEHGLPISCLFNPHSASGLIFVSWSINFQMTFYMNLFYMNLSSVYLFSIHQLKALIAEM